MGIHLCKNLPTASEPPWSRVRQAILARSAGACRNHPLNRWSPITWRKIKTGPSLLEDVLHGSANCPVSMGLLNSDSFSTAMHEPHTFSIACIPLRRLKLTSFANLFRKLVVESCFYNIFQHLPISASSSLPDLRPRLWRGQERRPTPPYPKGNKTRRIHWQAEDIVIQSFQWNNEMVRSFNKTLKATVVVEDFVLEMNLRQCPLQVRTSSSQLYLERPTWQQVAAEWHWHNP